MNANAAASDSQRRLMLRPLRSFASVLRPLEVLEALEEQEALVVPVEHRHPCRREGRLGRLARLVHGRLRHDRVPWFCRNA